ncbi:MAG: glycosyltransferase [Pseudomonadales bacterium]|nr:glycosyltransferase [Pseudomonadales bacterium]
MPKFSIVFASFNPLGEASSWICQQESDQVEVVIAQLEEGVCVADVLNQALSVVQGEYVAIVDESLKVGVPHWLELFQAHLESAPYQMLGLSGFEQLSQQDAISESLVRVSEQVASASGTGLAAFPPNRFLGDTHIKEVVMIDGRCIFASRAIFKAFPIADKGLSEKSTIAETLLHYQLHLALERSQAQGVLLGVSHEVADGSPWLNLENVPQNWAECYQHFLPLDALQLSIWRFNISAVASFEPEAAEQFLYLLSRTNGFRFQYRDHNRVSAIKGDQIALVVDHFNELESLPEGDTFVLCGAGTGLLIQQLLDRHQNEVLVVEPEYGLICELLKYYDWSDALSEGRLRFFPLMSGSPETDQITITQTTRLLQFVLDKNQRVTHVIRGYSYHLNAPWFRNIEQGLVQYLNQREFTNGWVNRRTQVYDVTVVSPNCSIFSNLAQCFNDLGLRTRLFNVPDKADQLTVDNTRQLLTQLAVDGSKLTLCRNRSFFETENVKKAASFERFIDGHLVNWWWDIPNVASFIDFNDPTNNSDNIAFAVDMLDVLPSGAHWLPPAANVKFCIEREASTPWLFDISFVGQSRIPLLKNNIAALLKFLNYHCGGVPEEFAAKLADFSSYISLYHDMEQLKPDIFAVLDALAVVAPAHVYYYKYIFNMAKTAAFRVGAIEKLFAEGISVAVFGDAAWVEEGVIPEEFFHGLIAPSDLPKLYQGSKVNLNLNFMQVSSTVNPKVFDILACDGAVVTDYRPEIEALFPDPNFRPICFNDLDEVVPTVINALNFRNLDHWRALGNAIRCKHTLLHRAQWFIDSYLSK